MTLFSSCGRSLGRSLLFTGLFASASFGQDGGLVADGVFTWINASRYVEVQDHPLNSENSLQEIPRAQAISEFRPNFRLVSDKLQLIARPRIRLIWQETVIGSAVPVTQGFSTYEMNEAFAYWPLSERFSFTVGLHSYQWGPAESLSPSNRIFHETALARDVLYEVGGRHMARLNVSFGQDFSLVLLSEYQANDDLQPFLADEAFGSTTAAKGEWSFGGGAHYMGLVLGGRQHGRPWVGGYASFALSFLGGTSVYFDASQQRGSSAYYPEVQQAYGPTGPEDVVALEQSRRDGEKIESIAVGGLRYDFVQGTIARLEYILNEPGYDEDQQELVRAALDSEALAQQATLVDFVPRALAAGLELPGKRYVYGSIFIPDFLNLDDLTATTRALVSLTDQSSNAYMALEYEVGDAGTAFLASAVSSGDEGSELMGFTKQSHIGGYRYIW